MAEIKNEYVSHDEELENLRKNLVEMNNKSFLKINQFKEKNNKIETVRDEFSKKIKNEEKNIEIKNDNEIYNDLQNNTTEYSNYINIIKTYSKKISEINFELQNKIIKKLDNKLSNELNTLKKENSKLKEQLEKLKNLLNSNRKEKEEKEQNKTLSDINRKNFIDDDSSSVSNIILEEMEKSDIEKKKEKEKEIFNSNNIPFDKRSFLSQQNNNLDRKISQNSGISAEENYINNLKFEKENADLFKKQLDLIKVELKETINEKNELEKKVNLLSKKASLVDDNILDKIEILHIFKQTFEKLVDSIQFVGNVKELVLMCFKLLNYSEDDIQKIIDKKEKRNLFGIFK